MTENNGKPWYKSKTIGFNVLLGVGLEIANLLGEADIVTPQGLAIIMGVGNILLRAVTNKPVTLKSNGGG